MRYERRVFLSRLLLLSASTKHQSSSGDSTFGKGYKCEPCDANMTFAYVADRRKQRPVHFDFIVDSGATVHCINDFTLFEDVYEDHPPALGDLELKPNLAFVPHRLAQK